jgi:hypothetical protein
MTTLTNAQYQIHPKGGTNLNVYIDMDGVLCDWNHAAEKLFGSILFDKDPGNYSGYPFSPAMCMQARSEVGSRDRLMEMFVSRRLDFNSPLRYIVTALLSHVTMEDWWATLPVMDGAKSIVSASRSLGSARILTTPVSPNDSENKWCMRGKLRWIRNHIGEDMPVLFSHCKSIYAFNKDDVLIDDSIGNTKAWIEAGGSAILVDSTNSMLAIKEIIKTIGRR